MPDSQCVSIKKYAVVTFEGEGSCEVIPTIWMVSMTEAKWPNSSSETVVKKLITDCAPPSSSWKIILIKAKSFTNSFSKAMRKAKESTQTSNLSSDSSEELSSQRKRKISVRYLTDSNNIVKKSKPARNRRESSGSEESESLIENKIYKIPQMPKNNELEGSTAQQISNSQGFLSKDQNGEPAQTVLYNRMFQVLEKINKKVSDLNYKVDCLTSKMEKITSNSTNGPAAFEYLPEDVSLPVTSLEELDELNNKLKNDKEFSAIMVCFLYNSGTGKTERSFILSLTRKVLTQEIAMQFSRYGRKGKKPFINYMETLNVILAAASLKFKGAEREDLAEMFGKSLAGASDWNKRKIWPSDYTLVDCSLTFTETE